MGSPGTDVVGDVSIQGALMVFGRCVYADACFLIGKLCYG